MTTTMEDAALDRIAAAAREALAPLTAIYGEPATFGRHAWSWVETPARPRYGLAIIGRGTGRHEVKAWVGARVVRIEDDGPEPLPTDLATVLACAGAYNLPGIGDVP